MSQDNPFWGFNYSPSFAPFFAPDTTTVTDTSTIIGSNIQEGDGPVERHVLEKAGSYGYQINRIVDVLLILLKQAAAQDGLLGNLKPSAAEFNKCPVPSGDEARKSIKDFLHMATAAAKASEEYKDHAASLAVDGLIKRMKRLKETDEESYNKLRDKLKAALRE